MLRIALIGCAAHSQIAHGPPLARLAAERKGEIQLVAACDLNLPRAQQFCSQYGFAQAYSDYQQMLEREKPDACVAVMPVPLIAGLAEKLLLLGMPCVIEKPMGASIEEVRHLAQVAMETGTAHMVSVNRRFLPHLNKAKAWAGENGPLRFVGATMLRAKRTEPDFIWETGMHVVDGVRHIVGEVTDFRPHASGGSAAAHAWYSATFRFAGGGMGTLQVLPTCGSSEEVYELMGEGFRAQVSTRQNGVTTLRCWRNDRLEVEETIGAKEPPFVARGEYAEATEFIDALREGRAPRPGVAEVLPSAELCARMLNRS